MFHCNKCEWAGDENDIVMFPKNKGVGHCPDCGSTMIYESEDYPVLEIRPAPTE